MRIEFTGRNVPVSERLEEHAEKRLAKVERIFHRVTNFHVVVGEQRGRKVIEITADLAGKPIRSEVKGADERTTFDSALEKLTRQVGRYKSKVHRRGRDSLRHPAPEELEELPEDIEEEDKPSADEPRIVRVKSVDLKPMSPEEAAMQMELLGHDFFLFRNADSDLVSVVYKRHDGGYGLLECES
jgi:putative sigma-54 modulation protein